MKQAASCNTVLLPQLPLLDRLICLYSVNCKPSKCLYHTGGTTEDLSASLAQSCPAYFKEDDKIFYEASGLLQRAEAATAAAEKDHLTRLALKLMMKVTHKTSCPVKE